jgi:isopenicillin-N N-acyltransferase like protein
LQLISVGGEDDYARGLDIGKQAREMIRNNVEYYVKLWKEYSKLDREWVVEQSSRFLPQIERYDSSILEELRGVAEGARLSLEEVVALNCRYEFVWAKMEVDAFVVPRISPECTALGAQPTSGSPGTAVIGQNWDYKPGVRKNCILLEEIQEPAKPNLVIHTEAGILGQKGMNSAGIGLLVNALLSDKDSYDPCVPFLIAVRAALNERTIAAAIQRLGESRRSVSGNLMLAQGAELLDIELTPSTSEVIHPTGTVLSHANSFVGLENCREMVDVFDGLLPDSRGRGERAGLLLRNSKAMDLPAFQKVFSDHAGYPHSICRHLAAGENGDLNSETLASIIPAAGSCTSARGTHALLHTLSTGSQVWPQDSENHG